jgi:hypothetical protein
MLTLIAVLLLLLLLSQRAFRAALAYVVIAACYLGALAALLAALAWSLR